MRGEREGYCTGTNAVNYKKATTNVATTFDVAAPILLLTTTSSLSPRSIKLDSGNRRRARRNFRISTTRGARNTDLPAHRGGDDDAGSSL